MILTLLTLVVFYRSKRPRSRDRERERRKRTRSRERRRSRSPTVSQLQINSWNRVTNFSKNFSQKF